MTVVFMKTFLIINTSYFGDVLLTGSLCRNIKQFYPISKVVFMVNTPFKQAAQYLAGVDEVICYDKTSEHKGISGAIRFLRQYRPLLQGQIDAAFVAYGNERGIILAKALGSKLVVSHNKGIFHYLCRTQYIAEQAHNSVQQDHAYMLKALTKVAPLNLPMQYNPAQSVLASSKGLLTELGINLNKKIIGICPVSKKREKDMPLVIARETIIFFMDAGYQVLLLGAGQLALDYAHQLNLTDNTNFLNLVNKTDIAQLAAVIRQCGEIISVDTGTLHLSCAVGTPVVALFYINNQHHLKKWAPSSDYVHVLLSDNISVNTIINAVQYLETNQIKEFA